VNYQPFEIIESNKIDKSNTTVGFLTCRC